MLSKPILKWSLLNAFGTLAYIAVVVLFMSNAENWFGKVPEYFAGITMLTLFVFSAAVVGSLILGRPILWYLDGAKGEAIRLFTFTLFWILLILCVLMLVLITIQ